MTKLQVMYRTPNSATKITIKRPEWAGHVERMSDDRTVKKVFLGEIRWKKKRRKTKIKVLRLY
jgi:hypothetical protein